MALRRIKAAAEPPAHLSKAAQELWREIAAEYELEVHQLEILRLLCETLDRLTTCRNRLKADGLFTKDRYGQTKPHPALKIEAEHKILFARLARELNLDLEVPEIPRKPRRY